MTRTLIVAFISLTMGTGLGLTVAPATYTSSSLSFDPKNTSASAIPKPPADETPIYRSETLATQPLRSPSAEAAKSGFSLIKQTLIAVEKMSKGDLINYISGIRLVDVSPAWKNTLVNLHIERLLALDPELAIAAVRGNQFLANRWLPYFSRWASQNLAQAMAYYHSLSTHEDKQSTAHILLRLEGIEESEFLPALLAELGEDGHRSLLKAKLSRLPAEVAFEEALALIDSGHDDQSLIFEIVLRWSWEDFSATLAHLSALEEGAMRLRLLEQAIRNAPANHNEDLLEFITLHTEDKPQLMYAAIAKVASEDPIAALPMAEEIAKNSGSLDALQAVIGAWARRDMGAAFTYVEGLSSGQQKSLYGSLSHTFAKESPREAALWALTLGDELDWVSRNTLYSISSEQPKLLEDMLDSLPKPADQKKLRRAIWTSKGQTNPSKAVADYLADGSNTTSDEVFSSLLSYWHISNPVDAAEYISQAVLDNPEIKNGAGGIQFWYQADPEAATNWVDSLPSGSRPHRDGLYNLVSLLSENSPIEAAQYVVKMQAGKQRTSAANRVAHTWIKKDPETFDQMVGALHLSEKAVIHMRKHQNGELD